MLIPDYLHQEHQISASQGLEDGLKEKQTNTISVVSPSKGDHATDLFTLLPVNNSGEYGQKVVSPSDNMKMEIQCMSISLVSMFDCSTFFLYVFALSLPHLYLVAVMSFVKVD